MRNGLGAGIVITSPKGDRLDYVLHIHFAASNNVAEYEALIHGLKLAKEIGVRRILRFGGSDLVIQQASGDWDAKDANMASYRFHVQQLGFFDGCELHHVPRANNEAADALSKIGSTRQAIPPASPWRFSGPSIIPPFRRARRHDTSLGDDRQIHQVELPIKKLDGSTAVTFLKEIIVRFGYPHSIITDNGSNFSQGIFSRYCGEMGRMPARTKPLAFSTCPLDSGCATEAKKNKPDKADEETKRPWNVNLLRPFYT
ncbi:hypothetical protein QYE76_060073 [Lolium multiflorum]|uniref:Integrase catalytic domain-containing protein n=1 Tax=Lolium multiflorum TaxID=4521 RepID=A0AAD8RZR9_LOLMU|nr:hypothetical protein QYE76_060073 [Lolium multiflorum]